MPMESDRFPMTKSPRIRGNLSRISGSCLELFSTHYTRETTLRALLTLLHLETTFSLHFYGKNPKKSWK